jgi:hypothetical protein
MDPTTIAVVVTALLAVSEVLSLVPQIKANGIFQLIYGIIRQLARR